MILSKHIVLNACAQPGAPHCAIACCEHAQLAVHPWRALVVLQALRQISWQVGALVAVGTGLMDPSAITDILDLGSTRLPGDLSLAKQLHVSCGKSMRGSCADCSLHPEAHLIDRGQAAGMGGC